jgi:hypothetical protein
MDLLEHLAGFTAFVPTGAPAEPVPSAVAIGAAGQRLWGDGDRLDPAPRRLHS